MHNGWSSLSIYYICISNSVVNAEQWIAIRLLSQDIYKKKRNAHICQVHPYLKRCIARSFLDKKKSRKSVLIMNGLQGDSALAQLYSVSIIFQQYILYAAAFSFLANWRAFRLCFLANFMFLMKLGSIPLSFIFFFTSGFLVGLRWFFLVWLWAVWFFDFAIL